MQLIDVPKLKYRSYHDKVYFHNFTDIHLGAKGCDEKQLRKDIQGVLDGLKRGENHYWFIGGDAINGIGPKDKRHDASAVADRFKRYEGDDLFRQQVRAVEKEFAPIRDRGLFVGAGNHETTASVRSEYNAGADLAERLDLPFAGYSAAFRLRLCPEDTKHYTTIPGYWHHGFGAARTKGAKANMAQRLREIINVDVYLVGHVHEPIAMPDEELTVTRKGKLTLVANDKLVVIGASYLKTYPTDRTPQVSGKYDSDRLVEMDYAERKGYRPSVIGHTGFSVQIFHGKISGKDRWKNKLKAEDYR